ncbi:hypothetical protein [Actinomadura madurae]|uniref:hypothetical protein n=1 Tax=Actinomadura madurae TaxID=1993 RepID=UPI0020D2293F|nr:hypothetical protein [Actinomadura madurae]MCQ0011582.1 hypothetical protein [Actinomadura madurae]MCQ0013107.1 hypothetical protein [Actinomadura madurae]
MHARVASSPASSSPMPPPRPRRASTPTAATAMRAPSAIANAPAHTSAAISPKLCPTANRGWTPCARSARSTATDAA